MPARLNVHFLILTFQRPYSLLALLESIANQSNRIGAGYLITIWDNEPVSKTREMFSSSRFATQPNVTFISSTKNYKMAGKRKLEDVVFDTNQVEDSDWIVHLDDDVIISNTWVDTVIEAGIACDWAASGSSEERYGLLVFSGQRQLRIEDRSTDSEIGRMWIWERHVVPPNGGPTEVYFAGHRALAVRASLARLVRHDPLMIIGGEDLDYSLELRRNGATIGIDPRALIMHRSNGESSAEGFHTCDDVISSWRRFFSKWGFVRDVAWREAGVEPHRWLDVVRASTPTNGTDPS